MDRLAEKLESGQQGHARHDHGPEFDDKAVFEGLEPVIQVVLRNQALVDQLRLHVGERFRLLGCKPGGLKPLGESEGVESHRAHSFQVRQDKEVGKDISARLDAIRGVGHVCGPNKAWPTVATIRAHAGFKNGFFVSVAKHLPLEEAMHRRHDVRVSARPRPRFAGERHVAFFIAFNPNKARCNMRIGVLTATRTPTPRLEPIPASNVIERLEAIARYCSKRKADRIILAIALAGLETAIGLNRELLAEQGNAFVSIGETLGDVRLEREEGGLS